MKRSSTIQILKAIVVVTLFLLLSGSASVSAQENVVLPRYPALSPDGHTLVFAYQGDLWSAPLNNAEPARRLTSHPAYESRPMFSPDGKEIAFQSNRFGRNEVFVMPASGGAAKRLTNYSAAGTTLQSWVAGGKKVMVGMTRELARRGPALYFVDNAIHPGRPKPILALNNINSAQVSPDGTRIAFAKGSADWQRRGYKGAANSDIWVYTVASKEFKRVTTFEGEDLWPLWMPDSKTLLYVSEQDGTYNLWKVGAEGGKPVQITKYHGDGVRFPSVSADGTRAAYELAEHIESVNLVGKPQPAPVKLAVAADEKTNPIQTVAFTSGATEAVPSPDGEQVALIVRSDVYVVGKEGGKVQRLTETAARESELCWSTDGKTLFYVSRRDGQDEVYSVTSADTDEPKLARSFKRATTRLTRSPETKSNLRLSPDGKRLALILGHNKLLTMDLTGANQQTVAAALQIGGFSWAPDSKWVAYAGEDEEFNSDIFVVPTDGSRKPINISKHPRNDTDPVWSPDGSKVFWIGERSNRETNICYVYLKKDDYERSVESWAKLREKKPVAAPGVSATIGVPGGAGGVKEKPIPIITVDAEGIEERVQLLTNLLGSVSGLTASPALLPAGSGGGAAGSGPGASASAAGVTGGEKTTLAFSNRGDFYFYDFVDGTPTAPLPRKIAGVTAARPAGWPRDGRTLYLLIGDGALLTLTPGADIPRPVAYSGKQTFDRRELYKAVYEEAWQTLNAVYYDPKFHGADWAAIREKYRPWAAGASEAQDFALVIQLMMGHLNSSHIGYTLVDPSAGPSIPTGVLGVIWEESYTGPGLKVARVIKKSPADRAESKLSAGDIVSAINGVALAPDTNPDDLLADTVGERTLLAVTSLEGKTREMVILPAVPTAISLWLYDDWVESRRQLTHQLSDGKLAYLHIRAMDRVSQDKFEAGLYAEAYSRDGLLIDVRDNGGGSTTDYLLTMLTQPQHAYTIGRDGAPGYPVDRLPYYPWHKPAALLINESSYSNAEIFAHAFHTIGRGPLIGKQTFGAVLSTGAAVLLDGSTIRTPGRGWYNIKTGDNEEHDGARPDIAVEITPSDELAGRDPQLEAAVKTLMKTVHTVPLPAAKAAQLGTSAPK